MEIFKQDSIFSEHKYKKNRNTKVRDDLNLVLMCEGIVSVK